MSALCGKSTKEKEKNGFQYMLSYTKLKEKSSNIKLFKSKLFRQKSYKALVKQA